MNSQQITGLSSNKWVVAHLSIRLSKKSFRRYMFISVNGRDFKRC